VVADAFCEVSARTFADWGVPLGAVSPPGLMAELADIRVHPEDLEAAQIAPFLVGEIARPSESEARVAIKTLAENVTAHSAATYLLESKELDFLIVRYPALAQLKGAFPAPAPERPGRGSAWAFLEMLDAFVARLRELSSDDTTVFICGGTEAEPFWIACAPQSQPDCLWPAGTSLYDIAPAMLGLAGLKVPSMRGRTPAEISRPELGESCVSPVANGSNNHLDFSGFSDFSKSTPAKPSRSQREMLVKQGFRTAFARAEVARLESRTDDAIAHYEEALHAIPGDRLTLKRLCACLIGSKRWQQANTCLENLRQSGRDAETRRLEAVLEKQLPM
ncbi:MAG TPA: tetratricopeptide repeat protein, partial [Azonexus sp.]|nr:tetratricopeptide repeat protein [Azonexus sp.]